MRQIGNIALITASILGAVFFTILLVTGNTMSQAVRERTGELGVFKAIGFTNGQVLALVLAESCVLALLGGALGLGLAVPIVPRRGKALAGMFPMFFFPRRDLLLGVGLMPSASAWSPGFSPPWPLCACASPMPCEDVRRCSHRLSSPFALHPSHFVMAGPINWLSQVASVTKFGLLGIPQRRGFGSGGDHGDRRRRGRAGRCPFDGGWLQESDGGFGGSGRGHRSAQRGGQRNGPAASGAMKPA